MTHPIPQRVAEMLAARGIDARHHIAVACSGGPDSAALAHACLTLARTGALAPALLIYVDHELRPDSAADANVVRDIAARWGGWAVVCQAAVDRSRPSLEGAARDARYLALNAVARDHGLDRILLAHTASDQAETVLMRMIRGTGVTGLAGIPTRRDIYLRPLLTTTRAEIEEYLALHTVPHTRDPMNDDPAFLRNRVRHHWLPALRTENPAVDEALCRIAESAGKERDVLDYAAGLLLDQARRATPQDLAEPLTLDTKPLAVAPEPVARRALALAVEMAGGAPAHANHLRALHALVLRPTAGTVPLDLPGLTAVREYNTLVLHRPDRTGRAPDAPGISVTGPEPPYEVRTWQPGDRMRPARLKGRSKKLSDLYIDAKVPQKDRKNALVVVRQADGIIVWAQYIGPAWLSAVDVVLTTSDPMASNTVTNQQ